ncbi:MAG: hypothetical protein QUU85_17325, partial [Candidatus Eisenbacteria bacterium]|nr:hypothetical protein [Candidatus Eisenbacteria bacterium]
MRKDRFQFPPPRIWPSLLQQDPVAVVECVDAYFSALRNVELFHSSRKHQEIMRKGRLLVDYTEELSVEWLLSRRCLAALETFQDLPEEARRAGVDPLEATLGWLHLYKQIRDVFRSLPGKKELTRLYEEPGLWDILREKLASAVRESIGDLATSEMRKHPHQAAMFQFVSEYFKTHPDDWRLAIFHPSPYDDEILDLEAKPDFGLLDSLCRPAGKSRDLLAQRVREERDKLADLDRRLEKAGRESIAFYQRARMTAGVLLGEATDVLEKRQDPHTRFLVTLLTLRFRELDASYAQVGPDRVERDVLKDEKDWEPIVLPMLWEPEFWFLVLRGLLLVSGGIDARGSIAPWASQLVDRLIHGPRQLHRVPVPPAAARARSLLARRIAPWLVAESTPIDEILEAGPAPYGDLSSPDAARCPEPLMASAGRIRDAAARYLIRLEEMSDAQKDDLRRMCSEFVFPHAHEIAVAMREAALEQIAEGGAGAARPAPPKTPEEVEAEEEERELSLIHISEPTRQR